MSKVTVIGKPCGDSELGVSRSCPCPPVCYIRGRLPQALPCVVRRGLTFYQGFLSDSLPNMPVV